MDSAHKNVALLSACQALLFTNGVTLIAINGLADNAAPITCAVTGKVAKPLSVASA